MTSSTSQRVANGTPFFSSFSRERQRRMWIPAILGCGTIVALVAFLLLLRPPEGTFHVVTPHGVRIVSQGMTPPQVESALGGPIARFRQGDAECLRYGQPNFKEPFLIHTACYEGGALMEVTSRKFVASKVEDLSRP